MIIKILGGFLMALADSVPGVSGGTIAFLLGLYDDFIGSLNNIVSKDKEKRMKAIKFLLKLGSGWIVGMAMAALVIKAVFEKEIYAISSLFLGLIVFAIPHINSEQKDSFKNKYQNVIFAFIGIAIVVLVTYLSSHVEGINDLRFSNLTFANGIFLFVGAMCAISAMVLPGISGSTILLVFGIYQAVMSAISGFLHFEWSYVPALCIFGLGIIAGVLTVVKGLKFLLEKHRSPIMYGIVGMMLGSFYAIVMGPTSLSTPKEALSLDTFNILFFIIGAIVILGIQGLKKIFNNEGK